MELSSIILGGVYSEVNCNKGELKRFIASLRNTEVVWYDFSAKEDKYALPMNVMLYSENVFESFVDNYSRLMDRVKNRMRVIGLSDAEGFDEYVQVYNPPNFYRLIIVISGMEEGVVNKLKTEVINNLITLIANKSENIGIHFIKIK